MMSTNLSLALGFSALALAGGLGLFWARKASSSNPVPVGPWDYPDAPNSHPMTHPGPELQAPAGATRATDYAVATPSGSKIRLIAIGKGNTLNPEHLWSPDGGLFAGMLNDFGMPIVSLPDQAPATDGRRREMFFSLDQPPEACDIEAFVPGSTPSHLQVSERLTHGWAQLALMDGRRQNPLSMQLYVDNPESSSVVFGIAKGAYRTIDSFTNPLGPKGPYLHRVLGSGAWGLATVTAAAHEFEKPGPFDFGFSAHSFSGPDVIDIELTPGSEPGADELALVGLDASGTTVTPESSFNSAVIPHHLLAKIARFEIRARRFEFSEFKDVKFDPDPRLWKDVVYGPGQPVNEAESGAVKVRLTSLSATRDGTGTIRSNDYVADPVLTPTGKIWRDRPAAVADVFAWRFNGPGIEPEKTMPRPWIATLELSGLGDGNSHTVGRIVVGGSNSPIPGKDFHPESNVWPNHQDQYGYFQVLQDSTVFPFSTPPATRYVQFKIDTVQGPWTSVGNYTPPLAKIGRQHPEYRDFTFTIGPDIRETYVGKDGQHMSETVGHLDLTKFETQLVAHLKSGDIKLLRNTSYAQAIGNSPLLPGYDFGLDAIMPIGDFNKIPLDQIATLEIQTRPIHSGYLVQRLPELGVREMAMQMRSSTR